VARLSKYSFGLGDRFGHQGEAQLTAVIQAQAWGIELTPIWNKSNREHNIIHSEPSSLRTEADSAVACLGWKGPYHVDTDHINLTTVDRFIAASDFYTIDVADFVARKADPEAIATFVEDHRRHVGVLPLQGLNNPVHLDLFTIEATAQKFLEAMQEAGRIYRHIADRKGPDFVVEVSVDETDAAQGPAELFLILAMLAREDVPVQTIVPKFTGRFNKGVDYVGDLNRFEREFDADLAVLRHAVAVFGLPSSLKLSVHSGSDKFSLYPVINRLLKEHDAGVHVKTAGTTWLEEVIGLAESDGAGLEIAKEIYLKAHGRFDELTGPYSAVIEIDPRRLPTPAEACNWSSTQYVQTLRHDLHSPLYNPHFRQLIHVAFKVAAEMKNRYADALRANSKVIARNVTANLLERHIKPLFAPIPE
jgi:hypothetical protein